MTGSLRSGGEVRGGALRCAAKICGEAAKRRRARSDGSA